MSSMVKRATDAPFFKEPRKFPARDAKNWPIGPRTKERQKQNAILNKLPPHIKNRCEIKLDGCLVNKFLSWAHSKKSRFITTDQDWQEAARACGFCADALDHKMSHAEMRQRVTEAIKRRKL